MDKSTQLHMFLLCSNTSRSTPCTIFKKVAHNCCICPSGRCLSICVNCELIKRKSILKLVVQKFPLDNVYLVHTYNNIISSCTWCGVSYQINNNNNNNFMYQACSRLPVCLCSLWESLGSYLLIFG